MILDVETGEAVFRRAAHDPIAPASMTKLMTLYLVFEALRDGALGLQETLKVSRHAAATGGSTMFLEPLEEVRVDDLITGAAVVSGNDAAVTLAEALAGDETSFARVMNEKAAELGLETAHFRNPTGLPANGHRISVADLATLSARIRSDFPDQKHYFARRAFSWNGIAQSNRNRLLGQVDGVDGMKTGHTDEAGYCIVVSAEREDRRVMVVLAGLRSEAERAREAEKAVDWAFAHM